MIGDSADIAELTITKLGYNFAELEHKLREFGPTLKRIRVNQSVLSLMIKHISATADPTPPHFRGVPVVLDLPLDHKPGFVFVYEA